MKWLDGQRYPLSYSIQDALTMLTPVLLMMIGLYFLE